MGNTLGYRPDDRARRPGYSHSRLCISQLLIPEEDTMSLTELGLVAGMLVTIGLVRFGIPAVLTWTCCRLIRIVNHAA